MLKCLQAIHPLIECSGSHQNLAQVTSMRVRAQFVEDFMRDRFTAGHEFSEELNPLAAVEDFLGHLGRVGLEQKPRDTTELRGNLSVRAGEHVPDARRHRACQAVAAADEQIHSSAALADPVAGVAGAGTADLAMPVANTDERSPLTAAGAHARTAPNL
ncbi:hypothetical protein A4G26_27240 [Mycobacterium kansasii]|nr:hypothetical protein A4G26_27240 [Mycobacterium kansasii]